MNFLWFSSLSLTLPMFVYVLLIGIREQYLTVPFTPQFVHVLLIGNSALNPILYSFGTYQIREAFLDLILCRRTEQHRKQRQFRW